MIPKKEGAKSIRDFGFISLVGCIYKLISIVFIKCLSKVLNMVIGECRHAFMEGRQITDVIMIVNEVVDDMVNNKRVWVPCKLDMEKDFDHVGWDFVDYMLDILGIG